ncbi:MAG: alkaline phosphatase D family protein [Proteobacteria bacterium]|nr:alkaline phosphatase D family protein [Pseudomonadota bacterium]
MQNLIEFFVVLALACLAEAAPAWTVHAGPMPGWVGMRSAAIWLQADGPGIARVAYWPVGAAHKRVQTDAQALSVEFDYVTLFEITELDPGTTYAYEVLDGDTAISLEVLRFHTQVLWQWRDPPPDFEVAVGSCSYTNDPPFDRPGKPYGGGYGIFKHIAALQPAFMLWLGDNVYLREADFLSRGGAAYRYRYARNLNELQPLLRGTHHVAIWDDHDYGPNNSNRAYVFKRESLEIFKRYWANPNYGQPDVPGIFTSVSYGDAEFFLMDNRYHRDADHAAGLKDKQMFGRDQMRWLKNALRVSRARFKFIVNGSEMLNRHNRFEGWNHFPREQGDFLAWLAANRIPGVMFLSGDRHFTKLASTSRQGTYDLYELTCSPLTSSPFENYEASNDPEVDAGTLVRERNFCVISFSGPAAARALTLSSRDGAGRLLWQRRIEAAALK